MGNLFSNSAREGADDGAKRHGVIQPFGIEELQSRSAKDWEMRSNGKG